jgi:type IV pilus assembly protein PilB
MVRKQRGRVCWGTDAVVDLLGVGSTGMEVPGPNGRTGGRGMSEQTRDARRLAEQRGLRFVDLAKSVVSKSAASLLPESLARRHHVVPIGQQMGRPVIALSDPDDLFALEALRASMGREFVTVVASEEQVTRTLSALYATAEAKVAVAVATIPRTELGDALTVDEIIQSEFEGQSLEESLREILSPPPEPTVFVPATPPTADLDQPDLGGIGDLSVESSKGSNGSTSTAGADDGTKAPIEVIDATSDHIGSKDDVLIQTDDEDDDQSDAPLYGPPLAQVLVDAGRVSREDMTVALEAHHQTGESLARYLFNQGLAKEEDLVWAMAQEVGLEFVDLDVFPVDRSAASLLPEATARHHMVVPIGFEGNVPIVAMANPADVFAMDDLRTIMGRNFTPVVATRTQIASLLRYSQDGDVDVSEVAGDAEAGATGGTSFELESLQAVVDDAPIVRYVNLLILQALNERASDIHIEPTPKRLLVRFRIDGVMHDATSASSSISAAVVSRLKVLGEMNIAEHRIPQEGRVSLSVSGRQIDLRLAVLPTVYGENVVMRILDKSSNLRSLSELGFLSDTLDRYQISYQKPYGVILVTGPTGAGKTTTLYATLKEVMSAAKSVVTVEDPVEYQIDRITQIQVNPKAGLHFSNALKSILRADPDIVLIGEIRDSETATIAMEAALSGHLVLTTLHTNTAASTPLRLTEMGIEPFLVTSAVSSILTQRLARVLCDQCKEQTDSSEKEFLAAGYRPVDLEDIDTTSLYRAVGCRACGHTGYLGRMVLAEVMDVTEEIDRMIIEKSSTVEIEREACRMGMRTLRQDGLLKAVSGRTTLEEVLRVVV